MLAIYKRELASYFHTIIGWIFIAVNLFFLGLYFSIYNLLYGNIYFSNAVSACGFIILLTVPVLTMRILAEERKNKTDQLILTAPVSVGKIVVGKFLALATIFLIPSAIGAFYPLIIKAFGTVPMLEAYVALLGYILYGLAAIAVGVFISSITENQVIAAVLSFLALFLFYMLGNIGDVIFSTDNIFKKAFASLDFCNRFNSFLQGTFELSSCVFFISITILFLYLTTQSIQKRRWSISKKSIGTGTYSVTMIVMAVAVFAFANLIAAELPDKIASIDITPNKLFSLTDETKDYLKKLDKDVTIYVYAKEDDMDETLEKTLEKYEAASSHIKVIYKDPARYPNFASDYTSDSLSTGSLILVGNNKSKVVQYTQLFETEFDYNTYQTSVTGYDGEGRITSAIVGLASDNQPKIYTLSGHNELTFDSSFKSAIEKANFDTEELNLLTEEKVPEDAAAVLIYGPSGNFSDDDVEKLENYITNGGNVFLVTNYQATNTKNLKDFLSVYGITLYDGLVADVHKGNYYQDPFFLLPSIEDTDYASPSSTQYIFAPYAQALTIDTENENYDVSSLLTTSEAAVAKADINNITTYNAEEGDTEGSFSLGAVAQKADGSDGKLFVFTSTLLFDDDSDQMVSGANLQLFSKIVASFQTSEDAISIPIKSYTSSSNVVPQQYFILVGLLSAVFLPIGLIAVGIIIWVKRRRK